MSLDKYAVVDLFCGVGGLTHGLLLEGLTVIAGIDSDPTCKYAYEVNNGCPFIETDIEDISGSQLQDLYPCKPKFLVLVGCAPCQPFSTYNRTRRKDDSWRLLRNFALLVQQVRPHVISMENVPRLKNHQVFHDFYETLERCGYSIDCSMVNCCKYGVPQTRNRLVLLASRLGDIKLIPPNLKPADYITVSDVIGHLPSINAGGVSEDDPMHRASQMSDLNLRRIKASTPGGTWRDWPVSLKSKCHTRSTGRFYSSVYGRMCWDKPAPTITTQCYGYGNGRFGHPEQHRAISMREAALLQTFPQDYRFLEKVDDFSFKHLAKHIGNAVPVSLGRAIGKSIRLHLERQQ